MEPDLNTVKFTSEEEMKGEESGGVMPLKHEGVMSLKHEAEWRTVKHKERKQRKEKAAEKEVEIEVQEERTLPERAEVQEERILPERAEVQDERILPEPVEVQEERILPTASAVEKVTGYDCAKIQGPPRPELETGVLIGNGKVLKKKERPSRKKGAKAKQRQVTSCGSRLP